jgi:hypothetical protein
MNLGNTCRRLVGRLVEVRFDAGYRSLQDLEAMAALVMGAFEQVPRQEGVILVADWRRCEALMGVGIADRAIAALTRVNPRSLRSALVMLPDSPTAVMQLMRIVKATNHANRQVFTSADALCRWLGEVTTPEEQQRLLTFLDRTLEP